MFAGLRGRRRGIIVVPVVVAVAGAAWLGVRSSKTSSAATTTVTERTVTVTSGTMRETVSASGTLQPATVDDLNFSVSGKVTAVNVKAGQKVAKGTVLATIDSASLQSQVAQAQATVDSDQASLTSDTSSGAATAQLTADQTKLAAAQAQLATAQASLAGASLTAPIDGTIATVNLSLGQQLASSGGSATALTGSGTGSGASSAAASASTSSGANGGSAASSATSSSSAAEVEIITTDSFVVNLSVDDTEIGNIAVGQQATVTPSSSSAGTAGSGAGGAAGASRRSTTSATTAAPSAAPTAASAAPAAGAVTSVGTIASSSSGVASFPVVVSITGNPSGFYAGATAQVAITYKELADIIQVPANAVTRTNGQSTVTVSANGKKTSQVITTGVVAGGQIQVTSGLSAGQLIVVSVPAATTGAGRTNAGTGNTGGGGLPGGGSGNFGPPPGGFGGGGG